MQIEGVGTLEMQRAMEPDLEARGRGAADVEPERVTVLREYLAARTRENCGRAVDAWLPAARTISAHVIGASSLGRFDLEGEDGFVLLRAVQHYRGEPERFDGYLRRCLRWRLLDCARSQGLGRNRTDQPRHSDGARYVTSKPTLVEISSVDPGEFAATPADTVEDREGADALMAGVDDRARLACERYADGYTMSEVASSLGISESRVSVLIKGVRKLLVKRFPELKSRRIFSRK